MIYDCFTFFNELDLLEIRLNVLKDVVDRFVLVESDRTFTNRPKALVYESNKERFAAFADRIIHVVVTDYPEYTSPWAYESIQRNHIADGLREARPEDVVLVSDVDEIPDPDKVRSFAAHPGVKVFDERYFAYYLNFRNVRQRRWWGTKMLSYADFCHCFDGVDVLYDEFLPQALNAGTTASKIRMRNLPCSRGGVMRLPDAGWHFTSLGGTQAVIEKLKSYSHQEHSHEEGHFDPAVIERLIREGKSPGLKMNCFAVPLDESFPRYLRENLSRYRTLLFQPSDAYLRSTRIPRFLRTLQGIAIHGIERILFATGIHVKLHRLRVWILSRGSRSEY